MYMKPWIRPPMAEEEQGQKDKILLALTVLQTVFWKN